MPGPRHLPDLEFAPAPVAGRVRFMTWFAAVIVAAATLTVAVGMLNDRHPPPAPVWGFLAVGPGALAVVWYGALLRRYRLVGDELVIERRWLTKRFSLAGLLTTEPDREALRGAWKIWGNDGLGAYAGRFRSKKLGVFNAYVSDPDRAVVLRWPDRRLVVSPVQPGDFVDAVQARGAGHL